MQLVALDVTGLLLAVAERQQPFADAVPFTFLAMRAGAIPVERLITVTNPVKRTGEMRSSGTTIASEGTAHTFVLAEPDGRNTGVTDCSIGTACAVGMPDQWTDRVPELQREGGSMEI